MALVWVSHKKQLLLPYWLFLSVLLLLWQGLKAFTDVNDNEKLVLNLWNRYIRSDVCITDKSIYERIWVFIQQHASVIKNAREQLVMLLNMFFEHRLITTCLLRDCMKLYDEVVSKIVPTTASTKIGASSEHYKPTKPNDDGAPDHKSGL
jgi:hypothetical protein